MGKSLLVSAAAGSGKTAVLAERCVHLVCDSDPRCNVSNLLVVTFTEAAAGEMKSRIELALRRRLESTPDDAHLRRQFALLEHIHCSTLHSFCNRLLRRHFHRLGLDPDFRVLDADEAQLLRLEVVRDLFAQRYDQEGPDAFHCFIDAFGDGKDDRLMSLVIETHELLCSLVDPMTWLEQSLARLTDAATQPLESSALGCQYLALIRSRLADLDRDTDSAIKAMSRLTDFRGYVAYLQHLGSILASWTGVLESRGYDGLVIAVRETEFGRLPSIPNSTPGKESAKVLVDNVQDQFKKGPLLQSLRFSSTEFQAGLRSTTSHAKVFLDLVLDFARRYRKEKDALRALDFNDLERFTLRLLSDNPGPLKNQESEAANALAPSSVARLLHQQFHHVLVDEYQDINELQDAILHLASHESSSCLTPNLFAVGDVKQSIYRFRLADPQRFLDRADRYRRPNPTGQVIDLQHNFRSRGPLLDTLNRIFERLMLKTATEIEYDDSHRLHAAATFPPVDSSTPSFPGSPIELHYLPTRLDASDADDNSNSESTDVELERSEREALLVARRIEELLGQHGHPRMHVADRVSDGSLCLRPIECRDIVILLRATRHHADFYADILRQHNIPVYNTGGAGYFDSTEIRDVLALLRLLDNQQQDIALASVLRSPLANLPGPDDALAQIRLAYPVHPAGRAAVPAQAPLPFHQAVTRYAREKDDALAAALRDFLADLVRWRRLAQHRPVADLLWTIYEDTALLAFCNGLVNGQQRCANLIHLYERARQFGSFFRQGLYRFIRFLDTLQEETDPAPPSELSEAENVVRIMSVHKAKGLEFPVVFLPNLGKRINFIGCTGSILADRQTGLALLAIDDRKQIRYASLAWTLVSDRLKRQALAEELRILYVAMTRAREHLILIGTTKPSSPEAWSRSYDLHSGPLPPNTILNAKTMLDWLGPLAASLSSVERPSIQIYEHPAEAIQSWFSSATGNSRPALPADFAQLRPLAPPPPPDPTATQVIQLLQAQYPHLPLCTLHAHTSVTEMGHSSSSFTQDGQDAGSSSSGISQSRRGAGHTAKPLRLPKCVQQEMPLSAAERGAATHLVLRHLDFSQSATRVSVQRQIEGLLEKRLLASAAARSIDLDQIEWLLGTDLGRLLQRNAGQLIRELPLAYPLPPARFVATASPDPLDQVMLRGRIDLLLPDGAGFILIDYKTDDIGPQLVSRRAALYKRQIDLYREAIHRITSRPVHAAHLVFLTPRRIEPA